MFKYEEYKLNGFSFGFYISVVQDSNILLLYQYCEPTSGRLEYVYNVTSKLCHDRFVCTELFVH